MTGKAFRIATAASSAALGLYSIYKVIFALIYILDPLRSAGMTILDKLRFLIITNANYWELFALGVCGLWLVFHEFYTAKGAEFSPRALAVKQIVFSLFILFSIFSMLNVGLILFYSFQSYQTVIEHGASQGITILSFLFGMIRFPLGIAIDSGGILFGIYMLSQKDILRKIAALVCIAGTLLSGIQLVSAFISNALFYIRIRNDFALYGITADQVYRSIFDFLRSVLILAAYLIIILYGTRKKILPPNADAVVDLKS